MEKLKDIQKKKLIIIGIISLIVLILLIILLVNLFNKKKTSPENTGTTNSSEPFVITSENGEKTNISSKVKETKNVSGLEFSDLKITMQNNETVVTGKARNPNKDSIKGFYFKLTAVNEAGETIAEAEGLLDSVITSGATTTFQTTTSKDFANCYDIQITKIKDAD